MKNLKKLLKRLDDDNDNNDHRNYQRNIIVKIDKDEIFKKI
jgi:hypothetical protein